MKNLKISKEISLPIDAVTQTLAAIGRKGAGKTYLATMIAEQMLDIGSQVVVIDPVGNWWGLRVGADGKSKGKDIFVIGGDHGDVPLVPEAGAKIAKLLVEKNASAVLDVSSFRLGERKRFCTDFGEELLHLKKSHRTPMHIFIEEAQLIIPQRVGPEEARMVGAYEQIVRLGRNYGIGCTLITQRPQSVNKEVLSQVECLCVLQVTGPHERKALEEWVQEVGADRKLVRELPGLERGEGFVWSPSWLRIFKRVHFSKKETFDASSTPEVGKATKAASLSSVDVKALREDMADVVAQAEKDDPVVLHRKIRELEKAGTSVKIESKITEVPIITDAQIKKIEKIGIDLKKEAERHGAAMVLLWDNFDKIGKALADGMLAISAIHKVKNVVAQNSKEIEFTKDSFKVPKPEYVIDSFSGPPRQFFSIDGDKLLSRGARAVLTYLSSAYPFRKSKAQMWIATGYAPGGGFNNIVYELTGASLIEKDGSGKYASLERHTADQLDTTFTADLIKWDSKLSSGGRKVFRILLEDPNQVFSKEELAQRAGYAMGGGFNNLIYELTGKELAVKVGTAYQLNPEILDL